MANIIQTSRNLRVSECECVTVSVCLSVVPLIFLIFTNIVQKQAHLEERSRLHHKRQEHLKCKKEPWNQNKLKKSLFSLFYFFNTHTKTNMRRIVELSGAQTGASMHQALQARSSQKGAPRKPIPCQFRSDCVPTEVWKDRMTVSDRTKSMSHFGS